MKSHFLFYLFALVVAAAVATAAEPETGESSPDWELLKDRDNVRSDLVAAGGAVTNEEMAAAYLARADALRDFRAREGSSSEAVEAKRLEALALLYAGWSGDTSRDTDRDEVVADVRADESIAPEQRNVVAAYAENLEVRRQTFDSRVDRLLAFEEKARGLIAEFPGVADNYEALLQLAKSQDDENGARIIDDLLALPAPEWILSEAESLKSRYQLIGHNLSEFEPLPSAVGDALKDEDNGGILIYTWAASRKASIAIGRAVGASADPAVTILGIHLNGDAEAARAVAGEADLPGLQLDADGAGYDELIAGLQLAEPGLVYAIDPTGLITSVAALNRPGRVQKSATP